MHRLGFLLKASLRTKVLVPVIACMTALIAATVFLVNERVTQQFEEQARENLMTANAEFLNFQKARSEDLLLRFRNLPNEPRYRAAFQLGDPQTLHQPLTDLLGEQGSDVVLYTSSAKRTLAEEKRNPKISSSAFEAAARPTIEHALAGQPTVDTAVVGERLFHVVSLPVNASGELIGVLTLGLEIGNAEALKFSQLTRSEIALLVGGRVVASTLAGADAVFAKIYATSQSEDSKFGPPSLKLALWGHEHYFGMAGTFKSTGSDNTPGYVLLNSYQKPLQAQQQTQQLLLTASLCAILIGAVIILWVVSKATRPLRELRDSVEAVGRGDLSRRVTFKYQDECGKLAEVYNRMTENLKESQEQLEKTNAELMESSRLAGMAEMASGVMHNVGNVLNSINVASTMVTESVKSSKAANLGRVVSLLREHEADLGNFLTQDPKGKQAFGYLAALSDHLMIEREVILRELAQIKEGTKHIEEIVHAQQNFSKLSGIVETLKVSDVVDDALKMSVSGKNGIQIVKEVPEDMIVTVEKHKVLQILVNLMRNAKQACEGSADDVKTLTVRASNGGDLIHVSVSDNGVGIDPQNMSRIFSHGFTTKKNGHGFGLHSSAAAAKQLGGALRVNSEGRGKGATFTLDLPANKVKSGQKN